MSYANGAASYALESYWNTFCTGPPIYMQSMNVSASLGMYYGWPAYGGALGGCGNEFFADCTTNGICFGATPGQGGLEGSAGMFTSAQDSYSYALQTIPLTNSSTLFPVGANGQKYCILYNSATNTNIFLLASNTCINGLMCSSSSQTLYSYQTSLCSDTATPIALQTVPSIISVNGTSYNGSVGVLSSGEETVSWTTYQPINGGLFTPGLPGAVTAGSWAIAFFSFSMIILLPSMAFAVFTMYKESVRPAKFLRIVIFLVGLVIVFLENVFSYHFYMDVSQPGPFPPAYLGSNGNMFYVLQYGAYSIGSLFSCCINAYTLCTVVLSNSWSKFLLVLTFVGLYLAFGMWFLIGPIAATYYSGTLTTIYISQYWNSIAFFWWETLCFLFDPLAAIAMLWFLSTATTSTSEENKFTFILQHMRSEKVICFLMLCNLVNAVLGVTAQVLTTYTFYVTNDIAVIASQLLFSLQHTVNICVAIGLALTYGDFFKRITNARRVASSAMNFGDKSEKARDTLRSSNS